MNHIKPTRESFGYIFSSVSLTQLAPQATALGEMTQNNGHYVVQGHSGPD